ncbi:YdaU family protein [Janthinobacterium sp. SUN118]|uniref:YdaU family protein n=1 Tax=Janthinobacterium sp. SUN118 TaxID=3004100 RepID=UPI0025B0B3E0|nr:YdaU family protein [Janthinobacterium sp. SUN118]MDN2710627.1 YdaU family protein [Janthinobacterium sp. SUN118]
MNYYSHHIGDYTTDTAHLSLLEDGAYRRLMDRYYSTEAPLSNDEAGLFRLVRARSDEEKDAVRIVLQEFFQATDAGWVHKRCDAEIAAFKDKCMKAADAANKRWNKGSSTDAMQTHSEGNADALPTNNQEPITNNHKPVKTKDKSPPAPDALFPGVDSQIVADFKALRTKHKAPITQTAIQGIVREAEKAGLTLEGALRICCERGWRSLKAEWITQHGVRAGPGQGTSTVYDQTMAAAERAKARIFGNAGAQGGQYDAG